MRTTQRRIERFEAMRPPAPPVVPGLDASVADELDDAEVLVELVFGLRVQALKIAGVAHVEHIGNTHWSMDGRYWHRLAERASALLEGQCFMPLTRSEMVEGLSALETGRLLVRACGATPIVWPAWHHATNENYGLANSLQIALNSYRAQTGSDIPPDVDSVLSWLGQVLDAIDEDADEHI